MTCKICGAAARIFGEATVMGKHKAQYAQCAGCGFIFVPDPSWLAEAYAEPINRSDTGYVARNLWARDKVRECIDSHLNPDGRFLDYAGGWGLFVRLMRDIGYDFLWSDAYTENLFCRGFEAAEPLTGPFEAVTAFEVFEHLTNPGEEVKKLSAITSCLIFSTKLVPEPAPEPKAWWYYGLEHGQHVALYTRKSLELLAGRFGCHFVTDGADLHLFSRELMPPDFFSQPRVSRWPFWAKPKTRADRPSLAMSDYDLIAKKMARDQAKSTDSKNGAT
ncbi:MAG TPA: class I SAM-dependent methyltransferase [Candidatus Baltobacteraceae bacterium]|jgi:hypothetical protein|nr:class I SAM-dependent methyltransferase [Candidatus Baltobacteraceae bacterium]